ncbi:MAG: glycosyltransferase [Bacteroidales bacterium]|nr:glycosyltransferase [Bacteroidales bacterium]
MKGDEAMRILFVRIIGRNKYGGGERWVVNAASALQDLGHQVFVAGKSNSLLLREAGSRGLQTLSFNIFWPFRLFQALWLARFLRKEKIDVVVCFGRELTVAGLAARWSGNPLVIRRASSPPSKNARKIKRRARWFADGIITNTATIKAVYDRLGFTEKDYVKVIYNGFTPDEQAPAFDFSRQFPSKTIVLSVGRLVKEKGYFYLIDALHELKEKNPKLLCFVIGDGKDKQSLQHYAREKGVGHMIHFEGYVHQPAAYYKGCDLFVHPSLFEGMPNAPMEAMAYGKPVIMTRVDGAEELSQGGKFAALIPPADPQSIAQAVHHALQNPEQTETMAREAKVYVLEKFGMTTMARALEQYMLDRLAQKEK